MFSIVEDQDEAIKLNVDQFMDSYARDITVDELKEVGCSQICSSHTGLLILLADCRANAENGARDTQAPGSPLNPQDRESYSEQDQLRLYRPTWMAFPRSDFLLPLKSPGQW